VALAVQDRIELMRMRINGSSMTLTSSSELPRNSQAGIFNTGAGMLGAGLLGTIANLSTQKAMHLCLSPTVSSSPITVEYCAYGRGRPRDRTDRAAHASRRKQEIESGPAAQHSLVTFIVIGTGRCLCAGGKDGRGGVRLGGGPIRLQTHS
jgi:hypothetical protein